MKTKLGYRFMLVCPGYTMCFQALEETITEENINSHGVNVELGDGLFRELCGNVYTETQVRNLLDMGYRYEELVAAEDEECEEDEEEDYYLEMDYLSNFTEEYLDERARSSKIFNP
jgi:hypothetical protein